MFLEYPGKIGKFDCTNFTLGENESQQSCDTQNGTEDQGQI